MERDKIILFLILILPLSLFSQGIFVQFNHPVHSFLERMEATGIIDNFSDESKPILRSRIADYLTKIYDKRFELNETDRQFLNYYINEFYFDITGKLEKYDILFSDKKFDLLSKNEKFIYAYSKDGEFTAFVKSHLNFNSLIDQENRPAQIAEIGGRFYSSLSKFLSFEIDATNGYVIGEKSSAKKIHELVYNFKFNERPESRFFDKSYAYFSLELPYINLFIGNQRKVIGYGINKLVLSDNPPNFETAGLNLNYKSFSFEYFHGWLIPEDNYNTDSPQKFIAHHRLAFAPIKNLRLGIGEAVIYMRNAPILNYLNPFNFYKSTEHQLHDKDNALIYFDLELIPLNKIKIYSTFLIDDIDFAKIGKRWFGNKTAVNIGTTFYYPVLNLPVHLQVEYSRIEPFTYSHKIFYNNFTHRKYALATDQPPNSYRINFGIYFEPKPEISVKAIYEFTKRGKNYYDTNGIYHNVGGDINEGLNDSDEVSFLDGEKEKINMLRLEFSYEFVKNIRFSGSMQYSKFGPRNSSLILSFGLISFL